MLSANEIFDLKILAQLITYDNALDQIMQSSHFRYSEKVQQCIDVANDTYGFSLTLDVSRIKSEKLEIKTILENPQAIEIQVNNDINNYAFRFWKKAAGQNLSFSQLYQQYDSIHALLNDERLKKNDPDAYLEALSLDKLKAVIFLWNSQPPSQHTKTSEGR
jgi:hypothetical protein